LPDEGEIVIPDACPLAKPLAEKTHAHPSRRKTDVFMEIGALYFKFWLCHTEARCKRKGSIRVELRGCDDAAFSD
jgi:hypothetical protein